MGSRPLILGVAGGSGSGKTTVVNGIVSRMDAGSISIIQHDSYYLDRSRTPPDQRQDLNYDHPESLDTQLLIGHLSALRRGQAVEVPTYDFPTHTRRAETTPIEPRSVIIVEGILILAHPELRRLLDIKVFVDTDPDLRLVRRVERDIAERGRSLESVVQQYLETVRPMHLKFVEPSKRHADMIIPGSGCIDEAVALLVARLNSLLQHRATDSNDRLESNASFRDRQKTRDDDGTVPRH
jgi:uridine kinase